jgi:flagellar hook-associated protein 1 FlgK
LIGGELGGSLDAGAKLINNTRRDLGLLALGISDTFNTQHALGDDLDGEPGAQFFGDLEVSVSGARTNTGLATVTATITDAGALNGNGYSIRYENAGIRLTNLSTGTSELVEGGTLQMDGFSIDIPEDAAELRGDEFFVEPTLGAAGSMSVVLSDVSKIAAADRGGDIGDNTNMLSLISLRDANTLKSGSESYTSLYGSTLSAMAVETRSAISNAETELTLLRSAEDRLEGLRGVNLDEEATNLIRYQQAYQAAAQVISVANDIFDTLLQASR